MSEDENDERNMSRSIKILSYFVVIIACIPVLIYGMFVLLKRWIDALPDDSNSNDTKERLGILKDIENGNY